jgi:hypothetical protein
MNYGKPTPVVLLGKTAEQRSPWDSIQYSYTFMTSMAFRIAG